MYMSTGYTSAEVRQSMQLEGVYTGCVYVSEL